ncbi:ATP-binding cassette domain-containing protein [Biomaibacter acetigenes]|uniref:ATP-binding cassette domain-containing protein n=1 Tax=Biomaibacter acetigenes TaxID=2316383 RepID=A0A3G2R6X4_9FIRM|nr:methionine ABC transporter ATP-binding protein [Biomaibacter acetigenes]AYO31171.1 ATP-binding cassette domain-containing protein [Biomaibacter acetigenes]MDN5311559.1 D-methionine transport system ATP-binding protein [Thermoanaerobacteraceae bacterium]RKL64099.1 methionine ABC transporter ATP-binding protein [Thermoanaerobacteraceae bacterium SP2]
MIYIKNLTKVYHSDSGDVKALDEVNLHIKKGEIFGIIGLSGAGKSTLLRCINMLEKPTSGSVEIDGVEMTSLSPNELKEMRKKIGMIFQHFNLLTSRNVRGNVAFPLEIAGVDKKTINQKVERLLDLVGLSDKADSFPSQLSGGQKQRVGIARALANDPKVLLCDEATSALDPQTTLSILNLLKDINKKLGITIVLITHEMNVIKQICNSVAVIEKSRVVEQGSLLEVFANPKTDTARNFLKSVTLSELPEELKERIRNLDHGHLEGRIVKIGFFGKVTAEPVISTLVKKFDVDANILYGNIDHIQDTPYGMLVVELRGKNGGANSAIEYLKTLGLKVEVIVNV